MELTTLVVGEDDLRLPIIHNSKLSRVLQQVVQQLTSTKVSVLEMLS